MDISMNDEKRVKKQEGALKDWQAMPRAHRSLVCANLSRLSASISDPFEARRVYSHLNNGVICPIELMPVQNGHKNVSIAEHLASKPNY